MTTIIFDMTNKILYADRQVSTIDNDSNIIATHESCKIFELNDTYIAGAGLKLFSTEMLDPVSRFMATVLGFGLIWRPNRPHLKLATLRNTRTTIGFFNKDRYQEYRMRTLLRIGPLYVFWSVKAEDCDLPKPGYIVLGSGQNYVKEFLNQNKEIQIDKIFEYASSKDKWSSAAYDVVNIK